MLILTRYVNESVTLQFGEHTCELTIIGIEYGGRIKLGFEAPREVSITRTELVGTDRGRPQTESAREPTRSIGWGPQS